MNRFWACCSGVAVVSLAPHVGQAATVIWNAPASCQTQEQVVWEAEKLLGRMLSDVRTSNFEVHVSDLEDNGLRLRLDKIDVATGVRRTRELTAHNCSELSAAAAIAIAASIQADDEAQVATKPSQEPSDSTRVTAPPPKRAPKSAPDRESQTPSAGGPGTAAWRFSTMLAGVADAGALPKVAPGVELEAAFGVGSFRVIAAGALFASQHAELASGEGGDFRLTVGALLGCLERRRPAVAWLGCIGFEVGAQLGEGVAVRNSRSGSAAWLGPRTDLGASIALGAGIRLMVRAGAVLPLDRSPFVVDGARQVHRAAPLTGRGLLGFELEL